LVQAGPEGLPAGVIADTLGIVPSSLSFHLAALVNAGLVSQRRQSRLVLYRAEYAAMGTLMGYLTENCCGGVPCGDVATSAATCCPPTDSAQTLQTPEGKVA
jgi:hypothetical protein